MTLTAARITAGYLQFLHALVQANLVGELYLVADNVPATRRTDPNLAESYP
jgi:hypothetical protein